MQVPSKPHMQDSSSPTQSAPSKPSSRTRKSLMLSPTQHHQVKRLAHQYRVDMVDFVMAAMDYFERNKVSPFDLPEPSRAEMGRNVAQQFEQVRTHNADIGNALLEVIRNAERGTGKHLQQQQGGTLLYLERIERTLLTYLTQVESRILRPLLEQVLRTHVLTYANQVFLVKLFDESQGVPRTVEQLAESLAQLNAENDQHYLDYAHPVLAAARMEPLLASEKPVVATPPPPVPMKQKRPLVTGQTAKPGAQTEQSIQETE